MLRLKFESDKLDTPENTEEDETEEAEDNLDRVIESSPKKSTNNKEKKKVSCNSQETDSYPIYQDYMSGLEASELESKVKSFSKNINNLVRQEVKRLLKKRDPLRRPRPRLRRRRHRQRPRRLPILTLKKKASLEMK